MKTTKATKCLIRTERKKNITWNMVKRYCITVICFYCFVLLTVMILVCLFCFLVLIAPLPVNCNWWKKAMSTLKKINNKYKLKHVLNIRGSKCKMFLGNKNTPTLDNLVESFIKKMYFLIHHFINPKHKSSFWTCLSPPIYSKITWKGGFQPAVFLPIPE